MASKKEILKEYTISRGLAEPFEEITGLRAIGYSPSWIVFVEESTGKTVDIPTWVLELIQCQI